MTPMRWKCSGRVYISILNMRTWSYSNQVKMKREKTKKKKKYPKPLQTKKENSTHFLVLHVTLSLSNTKKWSKLFILTVWLLFFFTVACHHHNHHLRMTSTYKYINMYVETSSFLITRSLAPEWIVLLI